MDERRQSRRARAFRAHRRRLSVRGGRTWRQIGADALVACLGAFATWVAFARLGKPVDTVEEIWVPVVGGFFAVLLWEVLLLCARYMWSVPESMYLKLRDELEGEKRELKQKIASLEASVAELNARMTGFSVRLTYSKVSTNYNVREMKERRRFHIVVKEASLTNLSEVRTPIAVSLQLHLGDEAPSMVYAAKYVALTDQELHSLGLTKEHNQLDRIVNLGGRESTAVGYWVFAIDSRKVEEVMGAPYVHDRPMWFVAKNNITQHSERFALNKQATAMERIASATVEDRPSSA